MKIFYATVDEYPPFRVDVVQLFGVFVARSGIEIDWWMRPVAPGKRTVVTGEYGQRYWISWRPRAVGLVGNAARAIAALLHLVGGLFRAISGDHEIVQVRDLPLSAIFYLAAARLARRRFVYWMSFPMLEGRQARLADPAVRSRRLKVLAVRLYVMIAKPVLYRVVLRCADHVFVQSEAMKKVIAAKGVPSRLMTAIPMGVNVDLYNTETVAIAALHEAGGRRVLCYVGAIESIRRPELIIESLALVRRSGFAVVLLMIGAPDGPEKEKLRRTAELLGLSDDVIWVPFLPLAKALSYVKRADICLALCPDTPPLSVASPTKLVEYLAMARPVVANEHPDQRWVIAASGAGLCVPCTADGFAKGIISLLRDPARASVAASRGPAWVREHRSYAHLSANVVSTYQQMLKPQTHEGRSLKRRVCE